MTVNHLSNLQGPMEGEALHFYVTLPAYEAMLLIALPSIISCLVTAVEIVCGAKPKAMARQLIFPAKTPV